MLNPPRHGKSETMRTLLKTIRIAQAYGYQGRIVDLGRGVKGIYRDANDGSVIEGDYVVLPDLSLPAASGEAPMTN